MEFGGRPIGSANRFTSVLGVYPGNWPVDVTFRRGDDVRTIRFRLEDLPFPKSRGRAQRGPDIYGPHPTTNRANRRAVRRAFDRFRRALAGKKTLDSIKTMAITGQRTLAGGLADDPQPLSERHVRPAEASEPGTALNPASFERDVWWSLMASAAPAEPGDFRVVGGDEVTGRISVVLERKAEKGTDFRLAFDDELGALLRLEFTDPGSGRRVRYEYGDYKRVGHVRLPHHRRMVLDDELYAEDRFEEIHISSKAP